MLAVAAAAAVAVVRALRIIGDNGFGLATGHSPASAGARVLPLTDWLTDQTNLVAGLPTAGRPLTFGDLWGPDADAWYRAHVADDDSSPRLTDLEWASTGFDPDIDLKAMTTCLTQGLPYTFPFADDQFHYCPTCLAEYFPATVTEHIDAHARVLGRWAETMSAQCPRYPGTRVRKLPHVPDLPIVLAARLSLSFPVLISAVPFYYVDFGKVAGKRGLVTAWFSDGGITSNFPLHFFDAPLPVRPTFGINLVAEDPNYPENDTFMPNVTGYRLPREHRIETVQGFMAAVADTMQNWPDIMQASAPGYRDRIVEIYLPPEEGGMNLTMTEQQISSLTSRGERAGQRILSDFDFPRHRWTRFRVAMNGLGTVLDRFQAAYPPFASDVPGPWTGAYRCRPDVLESSLRTHAAQLAALGVAWSAEKHPACQSPPRPEPQLRFGPHR